LYMIAAKDFKSLSKIKNGSKVMTSLSPKKEEEIDEDMNNSAAGLKTQKKDNSWDEKHLEDD
jgi:hypothetical protein